MATTQHPSTKQDILQYLLKQVQASAQELAESLDISPQAIRRHLKDLEAEGLIQYHTEQSGMGRPQHVYQLSPKGRARFPEGYEKFAVSLLDTLAEMVGQEQTRSILRKQWERKALEYRDRLGIGPLRERVALLVELRRAEGYMTEWHVFQPDDLSTDGQERFIITEYNCAISHIAESFPSVCGHELDMFAAALQDCKVERTHWIVNGENRCGYLIEAR